jgi:hypothetical protein
MPKRTLSDDIIVARMVEWHNLKKLHTHDRKQIAQLKAENKELRAIVATQAATIATLQI